MAILLDHLIVPSHDRRAGARFLAELLDVPWEPDSLGTFSAVQVNPDLTIDFSDRDGFDSHHYCFSVSEDEFDAIYGRLLARGVPYRSSPRGSMDMQINRANGGKNLYWLDADGHNWEMLTVSYARPRQAAAK